MNEINALYHELIIDHGRSPRNFGVLEKVPHLEGFNPLCGDRLTLYLHMENGRIQALKFTGQGCAISMASASLMTQVLMGKTLAEAEQLFASFHHMLTEGAVDQDLLGKLTVLAGVAQFPSRIKCATLAWHTLNALMHGKQEVISTEDHHGIEE